MSHIDDAKYFPCTACGADQGFECYPRTPEDANWVHTERTIVAEHNIGLVRRQHRIDEILAQARMET